MQPLPLFDIASLCPLDVVSPCPLEIYSMGPLDVNSLGSLDGDSLGSLDGDSLRPLGALKDLNPQEVVKTLEPFGPLGGKTVWI